MISTLTKGQTRYRNLVILSLATYFALIFIGGLVRSTGAGMGCPDWPRCFGQIVPPTDVSQLPANYKEIYKNRFCGIIEFNAFKTWMEYLNRLFGYLTGFSILAMFIASFSWKKTALSSLIWYSGLILVLTGVQAVMGGIVVKLCLANHMVTYHFLVSFAIAALLIYTFIKVNYRETKKVPSEAMKYVSPIALGCIAVVTIQVILGTFVRTEIDQLSRNMDNLVRSQYLDYAKEYFPLHKLFSGAVMLLSLILLYRLRILSKFAAAIKAGMWITIIVFSGQMLSGLLLYHVGFPAAAQPFHVLFSTGMFGAFTFIYLYKHHILQSAENSHI